MSNGEPIPVIPPLEELPPPIYAPTPLLITSPDADTGGAVIDYRHSASIVALEMQIGQLTNEMTQLKATNQQQADTIVELTTRTKVAIMAMPCPNGVYTGLPEEGWTGRPEDAPGATPATIEQCMAAGNCNCQTGQALTPSEILTPPPEEVAAPG